MTLQVARRPASDAEAFAREKWCAIHDVELGYDAEVHARAHVQACAIGARSKVWQFASLIRGAAIGADCVIGAGAQLDACRMGDSCLIGANVTIPPGVHLGNQVFVGPGANFCNDAWPRTDKAGFDYQRLAKYPVTIVEDGASIGAGAVVLPGLHIGRGAMIAAGLRVSHDVPAGFLLAPDNSLRLIANEAASLENRMRFAVEPGESMQ